MYKCIFSLIKLEQILCSSMAELETPKSLVFVSKTRRPCPAVYA
jgi:hypothetical protein